VDCEEILELLGLSVACQEDRVIGIPKRLDPAIGDGGRSRGLGGGGYGESPSPTTRSYSCGTKAQTSCAMNFTYLRWLCQTSMRSGSGEKSTEYMSGRLALSIFQR